MSLLSSCDCVQEDKAKTGGVTDPTAPDPAADRADEGLINCYTHPRPEGFLLEPCLLFHWSLDSVF